LLCPSLADPSGISLYRSRCPYVPPGGASPSPSAGSPSPSASASPSTGPSNPTVGCAASYRTVSGWPGGFQGEITVTAGSTALNGWAVSWDLPGDQTVTQVWNGTLSANGSAVTVRNASYNGSVPASSSTVFGFLANGSPSAPSLVCGSA
jgi:cellulase/cellobiase CelA1